MSAASLYDLSIEYLKGSQPLGELKGKVLLFVNVASKCGLTPQYATLQALHDKYEAKGLKVIGFPSNQFKAQEPGSDAEIAEFCQLNYGVSFPIAKKADVNGPETQPVWKVLKSAAGVQDIDWNFSKFLVSRTGEVKWIQARGSNPAELEGEIEKLL